ncbi:hypothetical protein ACFWZ3_07015 [Frateuria sp. GZRR35]|uniref:hypothetical protein n=1 Tax=Frateuria sp. GZRR35 TaxID=3351536 RepID=UPI003EDBBB17
MSDNFDPDVSLEGEELSLQTVFPTCKSIRQYEGADDEGGRHRIVFEMFAGLRVLDLKGMNPQELTAESLAELVCARVECHFFVKYDFQVDADNRPLDEECLALFAQHNVPFNVWPYWREIVQSACGRMGLPRIVLPPHRLQKSATVAVSKGSSNSIGPASQHG